MLRLKSSSLLVQASESCSLSQVTIRSITIATGNKPSSARAADRLGCLSVYNRGRKGNINAVLAILPLTCTTTGLVVSLTN